MKISPRPEEPQKAHPTLILLILIGSKQTLRSQQPIRAQAEKFHLTETSGERKKLDFKHSQRSLSQTLKLKKNSHGSGRKLKGFQSLKSEGVLTFCCVY